MPPAVVDPARRRGPAAAGAAGLDVVGLRFAYETSPRAVIDDLSFSIPAGGRLAIVGPSGAGKSTLVQLLLRFEAYAEGEIRIGGREVRRLAADDVRAMLAVASQRVDLFDATVRDNLALADPDLTDERARAALETAQLGSFVDSLPDGDATRIGEDGVRLSGGERRRLRDRPCARPRCPDPRARRADGRPRCRDGGSTVVVARARDGRPDDARPDPPAAARLGPCRGGDDAGRPDRRRRLRHKKAGAPRVAPGAPAGCGCAGGATRCGRARSAGAPSGQRSCRPCS